MVLPLIRARKRFPNAQAYLQSLVGVMVWALGGNFFGIIRKARREGRRIILTLESSDGRDVEAFADECSTNENAAKAMRAGRVVGKPLRSIHER